MRFSIGLFYVLICGLTSSFASPSTKYDGKPLNFSVENKTFSQVMELFKEKTGMEYDIPGDLRGMSLPLVEIKNLTLKSALLKVLEGSNTDYILIASPADPERIMKLLIIGKSSKIASSNAPATGSAGHAMNRPAVVEDPFGGDMGVEEGQAETAPVNVIPPQPNPPPQGAQQNPVGVQPGQQPGTNQQVFPLLQPGQVPQQSNQPAQPVNPYATPDNRKSPY
jgi:hypothetical protein